MVVVIVSKHTSRGLLPSLVVVVVAVVDVGSPVGTAVNLVAEVVVVAAHASVVVHVALTVKHPLGSGVVVASPVVGGRQHHVVSVRVAGVGVAVALVGVAFWARPVGVPVVSASCMNNGLNGLQLVSWSVVHLVADHGLFNDNGVVLNDSFDLLNFVVVVVGLLVDNLHGLGLLPLVLVAVVNLAVNWSALNDYIFVIEGRLGLIVDVLNGVAMLNDWLGMLMVKPAELVLVSGHATVVGVDVGLWWGVGVVLVTVIVGVGQLTVGVSLGWAHVLVGVNHPTVVVLVRGLATVVRVLVDRWVVVSVGRPTVWVLVAGLATVVRVSV